MKIPIELTSRHDVRPFLRHMTSNKTYDFCMFFNFINFVPIDLKIGTHIYWTMLCTLQKCIDQNNVTYFSMATKYPIIKHRAFFHRNSYQTLMTTH